MDDYLIIAHSVTHAQRMQRILERSGIRCRLFRAPRGLIDTGCAYTVEISAPDLVPVLTILHREAMSPVKVFLKQRGGYQEVRL